MPDYLSETLGRQLPAIQLGASLADRARNYQLDLAKYALQQQQSDMVMKMQNLHYADALKESQAQNEDAQQWYDASREVQQFLQDPTKPMPSARDFKSNKFRNEWDKTMQGLEQYSARAVYDKQQATLNQLTLNSNAQLLTDFNNTAKEIQSADPVNGASLVNTYSQQIKDPKTGLVMPDKLNEFRTAAAPILQKVKAQKDINLIPNLAKQPEEQIDILVSQGVITPQQGEAAKQLRAQGITAGERQNKKFTTDQVAQARNAWGALDQDEEEQIRTLAENKQWKAPTGDENKNFIANKTISQTADELVNKINAYEQNYPGKLQGYVGLIGGNIANLERKAMQAKTDEDKKAYEILQYAAKNLNAAALARSGKAVTSAEQGRLISEIGDLKGANFIDSAKNFAAFSALDYAHNVNDFKLKYKLTPTEVQKAEEYRKKYNLSGFEPFIKSGTAPSAPAGQPSAVNQTIKSFNTIDEAEKANLPKGTKISIGGRMAIIE